MLRALASPVLKVAFPRVLEVRGSEVRGSEGRGVRTGALSHLITVYYIIVFDVAYSFTIMYSSIIVYYIVLVDVLTLIAVTHSN